MKFRSRGPADLPRSRAVLPVLVCRRRPLRLAAGLIAALVIVAVLTGIATDYLWFRAIGFGGVFRHLPRPGPGRVLRRPGLLGGAR